MIALTMEPTRGRAYLAADLAANALAARQSALRVHAIDVELDDPEGSLGRLQFDEPVMGVLSTYILRTERYRGLHEAGRARGIHLAHTPEQSSRLMEFDHFYPLIEDLTARSVVVCDEASLARAQSELTFPVFTKGLVKSVKEQGWDACVAQTPEQLARRASTWGTVIAREILPLRKHPDVTGAPFPIQREYRSCVVGSHLAGTGWYWDGTDPFGPLSGSDRQQIEALVSECSRRLDAPLMTVDCGQLEDGSWRVIEIGDSQYSGICHMNRLTWWAEVHDWARSLG